MNEQAQSFRIPFQSLQAEALDRLRDEIIRGVWKPGERLQERLLCQRFGISRSPLREAYQVLAAEGFLNLLRNRGAVVSSPSKTEVMQNHVLLEALETLAIGIACEEASDSEISAIVATHQKEQKAIQANDEAAAYSLNNDLHRMIVIASHNNPVIDAHLVVQRRNIRIQNLNGFSRPEPALPADEHEEFIQALRKRSKIQAVRGMKKHLEHVKKNLQSRLEALERASRKHADVKARS